MPNNPEQLITTLAGEVQTLLDARLQNPAMIGIHTGGVWVAERLHQELDSKMPLGTLDINFYRDDFSRRGFNPVVNASEINFDLENKDILLVDDVLHTGRTIRAAMNEIFDYGRPASLNLIVLFDRGGRELPIAPTLCGETVELTDQQQLELSGPSPLKIEVVSND